VKAAARSERGPLRTARPSLARPLEEAQLDIAGRASIDDTDDQHHRRLDAGNCAPRYPDVCIPPPPDLNCADIPYRNFRVIYNVPDPDPHRFDADHDGIGCES
jgi:hypothetical protein